MTNPGDEELRYDLMVQAALRGVVRDALKQAAEHGLPGDHHFYISFNPNFPGVEIDDKLREQHGDEMTIVLQHQFGDLKVGIEQFEVTLHFNRTPHHLVIPYAALRGFFDPSVQFGLQFQSDLSDSDEMLDEFGVEEGFDPEAELEELGFGPEHPEANDDRLTDDDSDDETGGDDTPKKGEVVSLDSFRKKP